MVELRDAAEGDAEGIRNVLVDAFPTSMEADLVERLGREGDTVISMVACDDGAIVGHILFSRMHAEADGRALDALGLGPVAVLARRQGEGIGSGLIEAGVARAGSLGADIVFLVGEPGYYRRFGFDPATAAPFESPYAGPYFQAKTLHSGVAATRRGRAEYAPAFAELE